MMITILYILACTISITATVPQLTQLVKSKRSDEFSPTAWLIWAGAQVMTLVYVISIANIPMILTNIAWVTYYVMMAGLIYYYRKHPAPELVEATTN